MSDDKVSRGRLKQAIPPSSADRFLEQREAQQHSQEIAAEKLEQYKKALNGMAVTPNGELVLKTLITAFGVFSIAQPQNPASSYELEVLKRGYLKFIRPHLEPAIRAKLENEI